MSRIAAFILALAPLIHTAGATLTPCWPSPRHHELTGLAVPSSASARQEDPPDVDPKLVNAAIDKGLAWLLQKFPANNIPEQKHGELVVLTLLHAGIRPDHPLLMANFAKMSTRGLSDIYNAGIRGLVLEKVNRRAYQAGLAELAMFFMDGQCENGQWAYNGRPRRPAPTPYMPHVTPAKKKEPGTITVTDDDGPAPGKDLKLPPPRQTGASKTGDNSNTQYAVLGLFAATRAAVVVPKETWARAEKWFENSQNADGGWGYGNVDVKGQGPIVTALSTGSMTTAGLTALIVSKFYQEKDWKKAPSVEKGLEWLGKNFSVRNNPGKPAVGPAIWHYYYLYGLERVGMISGLKEIGGHNWYKEGAEYLLKAQKPDGSWQGTGDAAAPLTDATTDTCFAILFLRRATPKLEKPKDIATTAGGAGKKPEEPKPAEPKPADKKPPADGGIPDDKPSSAPQGGATEGKPPEKKP